MKKLDKSKCFENITEAKKEVLNYLEGHGKDLKEQLEDGDAFDCIGDMAADRADGYLETPEYFHNMNLLEKSIKELEREHLK